MGTDYKLYENTDYEYTESGEGESEGEKEENEDFSKGIF
jgi:hypothetical protein